MNASGFRPRQRLLDRLLLDKVRDRDPGLMNLDSAARGRPVLFAELFPPADWLPRHFGALARSAWVFTDTMFKPADAPEDSPPDSVAKSVQVADAYELAVGESRTIFLELWVDLSEPVLVPFPELAPVLVGKESGTLGEARRELHELLWQVTERLNLMMPLARSLAAIQAGPAGVADEEPMSSVGDFSAVTEPAALITVKRSTQTRVHALGCTVAHGLENAGYGPFEEIPLSEVPATARPCGFCGGPPGLDDAERKATGTQGPQAL